MALRPCIDCGRPGPMTRCSVHAAAAERAHHNRAYDDIRWRHLRTAVLRRHRSLHGDWCPGHGTHLAHQTADLTVDHVVPLEHGGALLDPTNLRVLCRSANSSLGARR